MIESEAILESIGSHTVSIALSKVKSMTVFINGHQIINLANQIKRERRGKKLRQINETHTQPRTQWEPNRNRQLTPFLECKNYVNNVQGFGTVNSLSQIAGRIIFLLPNILCHSFFESDFCHNCCSFQMKSCLYHCMPFNDNKKQCYHHFIPWNELPGITCYIDSVVQVFILLFIIFGKVNWCNWWYEIRESYDALCNWKWRFSQITLTELMKIKPNGTRDTEIK